MIVDGHGLDLYIRCTAAYAYRYYYGLELRPTLELLFQRALGEFLLWVANDRVDQKTPWPAVSERWQEHWLSALAGAGFQKNRRAGTKMAAGVVASRMFWEGFQDSEVLQVGTWLEHRISPHRVRCRVHVVDRIRTGAALRYTAIVSQLRGAGWGDHPDRHAFNTLNARLTRSHGSIWEPGRKMVRAFALDMPKWRVISVPARPTGNLQEILEVVRKVVGSIRARRFYPNRGDHCSDCPYNSICRPGHFTDSQLEKSEELVSRYRKKIWQTPKG